MPRSRLDMKQFSSSSITAASGTNTTIDTISNLDSSYRELGFQLENEAEGSAALDVFILQVRVHPSGDFVDYISDWSTESNFLIRATATLNTLADNTIAAAHVLLPPCDAIRFLASGNAATVSVNILGAFGRI